MEDSAHELTSLLVSIEARQDQLERTLANLARVQNHGTASNIVLMALAAMLARETTDPLKFVDRLRTAALDATPTAPADLGKEVERLLSRIERISI